MQAEGARTIRPMRILAAAVATVAVFVIGFFPHRILHYSRHCAGHTEILLSKALMRQGVSFLADFDAASPKDLISGKRINIQGAPRVPIPGGYGRRIEGSGKSYVSPQPTRTATSVSTYCLTVAPSNVEREQELLNQMSGTSGMILSLSSGEIIAEFRHGYDINRLSAPFEGAPGRFTHIAVAVACDRAAIYQNGRKSAEAKLPWEISLLPRPWLLSNASRHPFFGIIAEAAIWNRALDADEIRRLASRHGMKASVLAPLHSFAAKTARATDRFLRGTFRVIGRLAPSQFGAAYMRPECPMLVMHMKNRDERHISRTHERSLSNGYRTAGAAELRHASMIYGRSNIKVKVGLDDSYSKEEAFKRPAFILAMNDDPAGVVRVYPPEMHEALHFDAPELFPVNGRYVRLYEDSTFLGIYIVEPLKSRGSAWMERGEYDGKALYSVGSPKEADVIAPGEDREAALRRACRLVLSDSRFPWSMAEIKERRKSLARRRKRAGLTDVANPVAPISSILGENLSAMFITRNLALPEEGVEWHSSDPSAISESGRVTLPTNSIPRIVELEARDETTGKTQSYRLRVMPEKPNLPAIFIGIGSPIEKERRSDFVFTLVQGATIEPLCMRGLVGEDGGLRHRGNSSYVKGVKRSLSLTFAKPLAWPNPERPSTHLLLHNGYTDPTRMRNRLSFEFFHDAALVTGKDQPAPSFDWAEVFVNGEYFGVWEVSGRVRDLVPPDRMLFKIRGINSILWRRVQSYFLDCINATPGDETPYREIEKAFDFVANASKEDFQANVWKRFDLENLIPCYLMLNFSDNQDGINMNQYIALEPESGRTEVIPWDYDKTFLKPHKAPLANHLYSRLLAEVPEFRKTAQERWARLRSGRYSDDALFERIDAWAELLAPYMDEEWRLIKPAGFDGDFADAVEALKKAVRTQVDFMDRAFPR